MRYSTSKGPDKDDHLDFFHKLLSQLWIIFYCFKQKHSQRNNKLVDGAAREALQSSSFEVVNDVSF